MKKSIRDKVLSVILSLMMLFDLVPAALVNDLSAAADGDNLVIRVQDEKGNAMVGAKVDVAFKYGTSTLYSTEETITSDGKISISHEFIKQNYDDSVDTSSHDEFNLVIDPHSVDHYTPSPTGIVYKLSDGGHYNPPSDDTITYERSEYQLNFSATAGGTLSCKVKVPDSDTAVDAVSGRYYPKNSEITVSAVANTASGYKLSSLTKNSASINSGNIFNLSDDTTISASFDLKEYICSSYIEEGQGIVKFSSSGSEGTQFTHGSNVKIKITPAEGYKLKEYKIGNGEAVKVDITDTNANAEANGTEKTINGISDNVIVRAKFVKAYTIHLTSSDHGVSKVTDGGSVNIEQNGSYIYPDGTDLGALKLSLYPNEHYYVSDLTVEKNGSEISTGINTGYSQTYTEAKPFTMDLSEDADYDITVTFAIRQYNIHFDFDPSHYTSLNIVELDGENTVKTENINSDGYDYTFSSGHTIQINTTLKENIEYNYFKLDNNDILDNFIINDDDADQRYYSFEPEDGDHSVVISSNDTNEIPFATALSNYFKIQGIRKVDNENNNIEPYVKANNSHVWVYGPEDKAELSVREGVKKIEAKIMNWRRIIKANSRWTFNNSSNIHDITSMAVTNDNTKRIVSDISSNNPVFVIFDDNDPNVTNVTADVQPNENDYINENQTLHFELADPVENYQGDTVDNGCSGLEGLYYYIEYYNVNGNTIASGFTDNVFARLAIDNSVTTAEPVTSETVDLDINWKNTTGLDKVVVRYYVKDRAGNKSDEKSYSVHVNNTAKEISLEMSEDGRGLQEHFRENRVATIIINDREAASSTTVEGNIRAWLYQYLVGTKLTAEGTDGNAPSRPLTNSEANNMVTIKRDPLNATTGDYKYTVTITFSEEGTYTFPEKGFQYPSYTGIKSNVIYIPDFTVDKTAPTGCKVTLTDLGNEANHRESDHIVDDSDFSVVFDIIRGIYSSSGIKVTVDYYDTYAGEGGITVEYYVDYKNDLESKEYEGVKYTALESMYGTEAFSTEIDDITLNSKSVVYARFTDLAGNYVYVNTQGAVVATNKGSIELKYPDTECIEGVRPQEEHMYGGDVEVGYVVSEDADSMAGIKDVKYYVYYSAEDLKNDAQNRVQNIKGAEYKGELAKQRGNIFTASDSDANFFNSIDSSLKEDADTTKAAEPFEIQAEGITSNEVYVVVTAVNNAGIVYENYEGDELPQKLYIDSKDPQMTVEFSDKGVPNRTEKGLGYFPNTRVATITLDERKDTFSKDISIEVTAKNKKGDEVDPNYTVGQWVSNGDKHTIKVTFNGSAIYDWEFTYENRVGHSAASKTRKGVSVKDSQANIDRFAVDKIAPDAIVRIDSNSWNDLIDTLTFGIFTNNKFVAIASSTDEISAVDMFYYIPHGASVLKPEALRALKDSDWTPYSAGERIDISEENRHTFYVKVRDYAGNIAFFSSDGHIVDKSHSNITITPDSPNSNGVYNKDVGVSIKVNEPGSTLSGIKTIGYYVTRDGSRTQAGELYRYDKTSPAYSELVKSWSGRIIVDSARNNSSDVKVYVVTEDNAGNRFTSDPVSLDIDVTAPAISVSYDNNRDNGGNSYFDARRTATVVITERTNHFDAEAATKGISITARDAQGNTVSQPVNISSWTTAEGSTPDSARHTAYISYVKDANYTFAISYTDRSGNSNSAVNTGNSQAPYRFTVDTTAPYGSVTAVSAEGRSETWRNKLSGLTFGFWSNSRINVTGTNDDDTSPVASFSYYMPRATQAGDLTDSLSVAQLDQVSSWTSFSGVEIDPDNQCVVYLRIVDMAGNTTYINTDGLIVDRTVPVEEAAAPKLTVTPQQTKSGIYNGDVKVDLTVEDPLTGGTYSGIKNIRYRVLNMGTVTQEGTLFTFSNASPSQSQLIKNWAGSITVDSAKNNSNNVQVELYATDNSNNSSSTSITIKIDITKPTIAVAYDNNDASGKFFNKNRVATITVTERNFDPSDIKLDITSSDEKIPSLKGWSESAGSGNGDNTRWVATIEYSGDSDYKFAMSFTDMAGNAAEAVKFADGTVNPSEFTIDKTAPVIKVEYDDGENTNQNEKFSEYYTASRLATITIVEHNFDPSKVEVSLTGDDNGTEVAVPKLTEWKSNGDTHVATITYTADGKYVFSISCTDQARNKSTAYDEDTFYIDTKDPEAAITGVEDKHAYGEGAQAIPVITYSDANFDIDNVQITLSGVNVEVVSGEKKGDQFVFTLRSPEGDTMEWTASIVTTSTGETLQFADFPTGDKYKAFDDIYTLNVHIVDKAG
ncbi:MAG: hypothetical protein IJ129_05985, partial [Ruminococcus sp.]|nr:hypothetical protein [Ruminococcus sp.]